MPKAQQLKDSYGDDKMKLQKATMELYKKEKINPLGGCLPMIVQMPVFYCFILGALRKRRTQACALRAMAKRFISARSLLYFTTSNGCHDVSPNLIKPCPSRSYAGKSNEANAYNDDWDIFIFSSRTCPLLVC